MVDNNKYLLYDCMVDLQFYFLFNSISVLSGRWEVNDERLCSVEPHLFLKTYHPTTQFEQGALDQYAST